MDSLEENVFSDIERRSNNASSEQQSHTPFTKGAKLQKFNCHRQAPWQKDKNDNVQA
jgi:IS30 family transposase